MYRFAASKDFPDFKGEIVVHIGFYQYSLRIETDAQKFIQIQGKFKLNVNGQAHLESSGDQVAKLETFPISMLLNKEITNSEIQSETEFCISFGNNTELIIIDDTDQYEVVDLNGYIV